MAPIGSLLVNPTYDLSRAIEISSKVIGVIEKTHREPELFGRAFNVYSLLLAQKGLSIGLLGNFKEGEALCEKGLRFANLINHLPSMGFVEMCYSILFNIKGDGRNILKHAEQGIKHCEEAEASVVKALATLSLGAGYYFMGKLDNAQKHVNRSLQIQKEINSNVMITTYYIFFGMIFLDLKEYNKAQN